MPDFALRRLTLQIEEIHHEGGPISTPRLRGAILAVTKNRLAVMAMLADVVRLMRNHEAWETGHEAGWSVRKAAIVVPQATAIYLAAAPGGAWSCCLDGFIPVIRPAGDGRTQVAGTHHGAS